MTVTDTEAPSAVTSDAPALAPPRPAPGFAALIGTGDHRKLGRLWIGTSFLFLLASFVYGALIGLEEIDTSGIATAATHIGDSVVVGTIDRLR